MKTDELAPMAMLAAAAAPPRRRRSLLRSDVRVLAVFLALTAALAWQLLSAALGYFNAPVDPLAF